MIPESKSQMRRLKLQCAKVEHRLDDSGECWCCPKLSYRDPVTMMNGDPRVDDDDAEFERGDGRDVDEMLDDEPVDQVGEPGDAEQPDATVALAKVIVELSPFTDIEQRRILQATGMMLGLFDKQIS